MTPLRDAWQWLRGYREVPYSARALFRRELFHMMWWGVPWGALNGEFCGFVAARSLGAHSVLVGIIVASISMANLFAVWWGGIIARGQKARYLVPAVTALALLLLTFLFTPLLRDVGAAAPPSGWNIAAVVFALQIVAAWVLIQAVNTVRTAIWRLNYPASHRGRILARFAIWQMVWGGLTSGLAGAYYDGTIAFPGGLRLDLHALPYAGTPDAYRLIFPLAALGTAVSAVFYRRLTVRGESRTAAPRRPDPPDPAVTEATYLIPGWLQMLRTGLAKGLRDAARVLRRDRRYAEYMGWQMCAGSGKMITDVARIKILDETFGVNYVSAALLLAVLPQAISILTIPQWARIFDRWPLLRFRVVHMIAWVACTAMLGVGVWQHSLWLVGLGLSLEGLAIGAGRLSWQLAHMSFASERDDALYMGVHQTLTGVRGLTMPLAGALLYQYVVGWHVIWIAVGLMAVSTLGFEKMRRDELRTGAQATVTP